VNEMAIRAAFPLTLALSPKRRGDRSCSHFCGGSSPRGEGENRLQDLRLNLLQPRRYPLFC
jgi:hypothetical protein